MVYKGLCFELDFKYKFDNSRNNKKFKISNPRMTFGSQREESNPFVNVWRGV